MIASLFIVNLGRSKMKWIVEFAAIFFLITLGWAMWSRLTL